MKRTNRRNSSSNGAGAGRRRGPRKLGDVVNDLLARRGYAQEQSVAECQRAWRLAVGEHLGPHTKVGVVRRGVLEVIVRNSAILQELSFRKQQILRELSQNALELSICDLRLRIGAID